MYKGITSKTHWYISIRTLPSDYILKKFHKNEPKAIETFNKEYNLYLDFFRDLFKHIIGEDFISYSKKYMFDSMECMKEEIHEKIGIFIAHSGNTKIYCIPKTSDNEKIYQYIIDNVPNKYKILKKTVGTYMDMGVSRFHRNSSLKFSTEIKADFKLGISK